MGARPDNTAAAEKEVASTAPLAPDGRVQRNRSAEVTPRPPTRCVVRNQAEFYGGTAVAGTKKSRRPCQRRVADKVDVSGFKDIGYILDDFGGEARAKPGRSSDRSTKLHQCWASRLMRLPVRDSVRPSQARA